MSTAFEITTPVRQPEVIPFALDGREIAFTAPKTAMLSRGVGNAAQRLESWLLAGLSEEDGQWLLGRLDDPADDLDSDTVAKVTTMLFTKIAEKAKAKSPEDHRPKGSKKQ
jgi:hypothetical protein